MKELSGRSLAVVGGLLLLVVGGLVTVFWLALGGAAPEKVQVQLEVVRIGLTIALGTGGILGLYLAWRRQRSTEVGLRQKQQDQADVARAYALQERTALTSEADAAARRITELYTKAVEQLGSDKAPVRMGGLYALERLAQDNKSQRQTIVNVLCAYLRMPYMLPGDPPADDADEKLIDTHRERVQEREVRRAAQRLLAAHLRPGGDPDSPVETFWADIDIDLTNAVLIDFILVDCTVRDARFRSTTFAGNAYFGSATFTGDTNFGSATFTGNVNFISATFTKDADFSSATLPSTRYTGPDTRSPWTDFRKARFGRGVLPEVARFVVPPDAATGNPPGTE